MTSAFVHVLTEVARQLSAREGGFLSRFTNYLVSTICAPAGGPFPSAPGSGGFVRVNPLDLPNMLPQPAWAQSTQPQPAGIPAGAGPAHKRDPAFAAYMAQFGKVYSTEAEAAQRYAIFTSNKRLIDGHNRRNHARGSSLRLALNDFADATKEEMAPRYGRKADGSRAAARANRGASNGAHATHSAPSTKNLRAALPASVDWSLKGAVSPVPDQAICGSCWAHGATATLEGQYFLKTGKMVVFSKQELMDCSWTFGNNACDGGNDFMGEWLLFR